MLTIEDKIKKIESLMNDEVYTLWGPCYIQEVSKENNCVFLTGDESFCVEIDDFLDCLC